MNSEKIKNFFKTRHGFSFKSLYEKMQENLALMICTCIFSIFLMSIVALIVFFVHVQGAEKVMVPNVVGKQLEDALLEMQVKELYPKINLRYSEVPGDEGTILDQSPSSGSIVKGYSRVSLVVSRGVIVDSVENYVGTNLEDLRMKLQTLFAGSTKPLIVLGNISYTPDTTEAGTILEQDPPEGTSITEPVTVNLVVSRGPNYDNTRPPYLVGKSVNDVLQTITRSKLIFDFVSHTAAADEVPGTVVSQQKFEDEFVPNYTHMTLEMAMPSKSEDENVYGIFEKDLDVYPYPVSMKLEAVPQEGDPYTIISFNHTGGKLTLPYAVPSDTTLVLYVSDKVKAKETVR